MSTTTPDTLADLIVTDQAHYDAVQAFARRTGRETELNRKLDRLRSGGGRFAVLPVANRRTPPAPGGPANSFGRAIRKKDGQIYGGKKIVVAFDSHAQANRCRLLDPMAEGGEQAG